MRRPVTGPTSGAPQTCRVTYSIVARDPSTGAMGVAVQSHWFNVGGLVPAAIAGIGAVATQASPNTSFKPQGLALLRQGRTAEQVVAALLDGDDAAQHRQFAVVDAHGGAAGHTGSACMPVAGHLVGDGFVVQANIMRSAAIQPAMRDAFEATRGGGLVPALLATLDASEAAGGDLRGRQSAAILVVPGEGGEADRLADLRVDDSPDPLRELRRLVGLNDAYVLADEGDALSAHGDFPSAADRYVRAFEAAPDAIELQFWAGLGLIAAGSPDRGAALVRQTVDRDASWLELLRRLDPASVPAAPEALRLLQQ